MINVWSEIISHSITVNVGIINSLYYIRQLSELKKSQQKLLADKEKETVARLSNLQLSHKSQLSGDFSTLSCHTISLQLVFVYHC